MTHDDPQHNTLELLRSMTLRMCGAVTLRRVVQLDAVMFFDQALQDQIKPSDGGTDLPVTSWIQIACVGRFRGHSAGGFEFTPAVFEQIARNFKATKNRHVPVDFEHATELATPSVMQGGAPATGWICELDNRGQGGLWGFVQWLEPGLTYIREGRYKYFSPAVIFDAIDPVSGADIGPVLVSGALTNRPFLDGMQPLAARATVGDDAAGATSHAGGSMTLEELIRQLCAALGIDPSTVGMAAPGAPPMEPKVATEIAARLTAQVTAMRTSGDTARSQVPMLASRVTALETDNKTLRDAVTSRDKQDAEREVDALIAAKTISPEVRESAVTLRMSNPAAFAAVLPTRPTGQVVPPHVPPANLAALMNSSGAGAPVGYQPTVEQQTTGVNVVQMANARALELYNGDRANNKTFVVALKKANAELRAKGFRGV